MRFQNGDTVKISKKSYYYTEGSNCNPKDTEGKIRSLDSGIGMQIIVDWDNGDYAYYAECDLKLVRREQ